MSRRKIPWPGGPSMKQYFSLPSSIIYYMAMNPSTPEVYNKLIQSCKYFFEENPILVVQRLGNNNFVDETVICTKKSPHDARGCCVFIDINKIKSRLWLTYVLKFSENNISYSISTLCSKIFRCDIVKLLVEKKSFDYEDFKLLTSSAEKVHLFDVEITYSNGNVVMLEKIVEAIPRLEIFAYEFRENVCTATAETIKNISKLKNFKNVKMFGCINIPEIYKAEDLLNLIMNHKDTIIALEFIDNLSEGYKIQLDALIDTVIKSDIPKCAIEYDGQDIEKQVILEKWFFDGININDDAWPKITHEYRSETFDDDDETAKDFYIQNESFGYE